MADADGELTVAQRLGHALDRGLLPAGGPAEAAERLIERLERPARIALLGLPGSGKSSILNLLVGNVVVPETLRLPTMIVQFGDVPRMICTLTDGTTKILPGSDLTQVLPLAPALVTLEIDLPALKVISLLEVSAGPMEVEQKRAATWASKRADIVIWCTTSYLPKEQAVWESLPDAVKDNSFMFLTKVDLLGSRESASAMHQRVELRAGEEFRQIHSISAKQARAATPAGGQVNRELFRDSGASAIIAAIKTRVQSGRRADMDTAELLLARHVEASEFVARRFAGPGEEAVAEKPWTPPPEPDDAVVHVEEEKLQADQPEPVVTPAPDDFEKTPEVEVQPAPAVAAEPDTVPAEEKAEEPVGDGDAAVVPASDEPEAEAEPEPEFEPTTRKRFADRIKRVASDSDAAAPMVPLRSTWKSKSEPEVVAPQDLPPPARATEPTRRPRVTAPVAQEEAEDVARMLANVALESDEPAVVVPSRERGPRAVTPRPEPVTETARTSRPQLFGNKRGSDAADAPLPDLSALRATPEEMAASAEANGLTADNDVQGEEPSDAMSDADWHAARPEPAPAPDAEPDAPAAVAAPAASVDRSRLFDRKVQPKAETPPTPEPGQRTSPLSRLPAPPRMAPPVTAPDRVSSSRAMGDESQFTPRAIMTRDWRAEQASPLPRRERTRIAARAVPVVAGASPSATVSATDQSLLEDAVGLIVARAKELDQDLDPEAKVPVDMILEHVRETGEQVIALVSRGQSEAIGRINSDLAGIMDLIMLMQLEKGHAPADDALTLLLQVKRELETLRAT